MIITTVGKYIALEDIITRNSITITTIPKGTTINITKVDSFYHKVIGPELLDWAYWDLPVREEN